jgi:hypothetical protein
MAPTPIPGLQPPDQLLAQYNALNMAIASAVKVVRFQDRTVEYASIDEMIKAANYIAQLLAAMGIDTGAGSGGASGGYRQIRMYTNKGL